MSFLSKNCCAPDMSVAGMPLRRTDVVLLAAGVLACALAGGCMTATSMVSMRETPQNPLADKLNLFSRQGPEPTPRIKQLLRRNDLAGELRKNRSGLLEKLEEINRREPNPENEYAMAELAYLIAKKADTNDKDLAVEYYGTSLIHAYTYLFADAQSENHNPYDPQFRGACDLYNQSLEEVLRYVQKHGQLRPGVAQSLKTANHTCTFDVVRKSSGWDSEDFDRFEFVNDYNVQGLRNHYHSYGLGVPLIAIRRPSATPDPAEKFYPPSLSFPITAFLRVTPAESDAPVTPVSSHANAAAGSAPANKAPHFVLELYDPLERQSIKIAGRTVPLEADLSTPLAYYLSQPDLAEGDISTLGFLMPDKVKQAQGLYMLEPFDPNKMPVVMVHGLWSSPVTWMEMFNDLRSDPLVRENYQFWFYLYPTGQPFWLSASQMREDLAAARKTLDSNQSYPALDQMVLVGHSMGGLVSKLQTVDSDDLFWKTLSDRPFSELDADPELHDSLAKTFFFQPNPSVRRVVSIGTPYRGSEFSNEATRWLGAKLITLPTKMLDARQMLLARNSGYFRPDAPLDIKTSIDSLAPDSPLLPVLLEAEPGQWVRYHNIIGKTDTDGFKGYFLSEGDGVVPLESARLEPTKQLRSQITISSDHVHVHRDPGSILEVRRVLLEQLAELQNFPNDVSNTMTASASVSVKTESTKVADAQQATRLPEVSAQPTVAAAPPLVEPKPVEHQAVAAKPAPVSPSKESEPRRRSRRISGTTSEGFLGVY